MGAAIVGTQRRAERTAPTGDGGTTNPALRLGALAGGRAFKTNRRARVGRGAELANAELLSRQWAGAAQQAQAPSFPGSPRGPAAGGAGLRVDRGVAACRVRLAGSTRTLAPRTSGACPPPRGILRLHSRMGLRSGCRHLKPAGLVVTRASHSRACFLARA